MLFYFDINLHKDTLAMKQGVVEKRPSKPAMLAQDDITGDWLARRGSMHENNMSLKMLFKVLRKLF